MTFNLLLYDADNFTNAYDADSNTITISESTEDEMNLLLPILLSKANTSVCVFPFAE